ncbi:MAG TPA: bifunctional 4-hydroxy-2-oxoglutarate aldolase/2-dehydro-3-deoxy-phosphogluconate aldolase [Microbacterium sp.]|uniref:bifunctional 4-hydroxy-2-oxoglutarate aldolase/2-dehydro-3-deoxy-phosphogluconate aldolase n=1 Tax=Microbacterium sp. TaxID=51671 RepID=UPI002F92BC0A
MRAALAEERLLDARALVLLRSVDIADEALDAYVDGGLRVIEVSMVAADAVSTIARLRRRHPTLLLGAGTVRTTQQADAAVSAGADFLVSPSAAAAVSAWAGSRDLLHLPGVFTPTEVDLALERGARLLKLFPAARFGPAYLRDLATPFATARFFVSGGISIDAAPDYLAAGAVLVGMGGALAATTVPAEIIQQSRALMKAVTR